MVELSNSAVMKAATDKMIRSFALADGGVESGRIDFIGKLASAYADDVLAHSPIKADAKGGVREAVEGDYADYALGVYNSARAEKTGKILPVHASRKSEWAAIFRATRARKDIVSAALAVYNDLRAESDARKAAMEARGEKVSASDLFTVKTYDAVLKVTNAQAKAFGEKGVEGAFNSDDIRAVFDAAPKAPNEVKDAEGVAKKLRAMGKAFPLNAATYERLASDLDGVVAKLKSASSEAANRQAAIDYLVSRGVSIEVATTTVDTPAQNAPDGGRVLQAA